MESSVLHPLAAIPGHGVDAETVAVHPLRFAPRRELLNWLGAIAALSGVCVIAGLVLAPARVWPSLLLASLYLVGMGLGAIFFIALQYATGAGWGVVFRRVPEAMASVLPFGAVGLAVVFLLHPEIYPWSAGLSGEVGGTYAFKAMWLSRPFFLVRSAIYLATWMVFSIAIVRNSRRQDTDGDLCHTRRNARLSVGFLPVFAVTVSLASFDWIMSLEPNWYSTIFGVYHFAGLFSASLASIIVLVVILQNLGPRGMGPFHGSVGAEHLHDLGKLLFGFCTFWMYIWFSQYMLIWYSNLPEETIYFVARQHGLWAPLFYLNVCLNWVVPFLVLLGRGAKRAPTVIVKVALVVLVGRYLDLYLMVMPPFAGASPVFGLWELAPVLLGGGLLALVVLRALASAAIIPRRDPLLSTSLHHHQ
jgi:hypothetical protein